MLEKIYISDPKHTDLNMYRCGIEDCAPGYSWGPALRDHYIIHYILDGKGTYTVNNHTYELTKGQGFLICPNTRIFYQADSQNPWSYGWVGFHGVKAKSYLDMAGISEKNPVFAYDKDDSLNKILQMMINTKNLYKSKEIVLLGYLYQFLGMLIENAPPSCAKPEPSYQNHIKKALEFIAMNYSQKIEISDISSYIGLDRSYLYSLFVKHLNISPKDYLIRFRMQKATELIRNNNLTIGEVSRSVGYDDPLLFSKMFKKIYGQSPSQYRKNLIS